MRLNWLAALALIGLAIPLNAQQAAPTGPGSPAPTAPPTSQMDKLSYAIGAQVGQGIKSQGIDVNVAMVLQGVRDVLAGSNLLMSDDEISSTIAALEQQLKNKQDQALAAMAENNKKAGAAFLADNAKKEGVVALPSGLQYKIITAGTGKMPTDADTVVCHYRGTLMDGREFDSSYGGMPATFAVKDVIPGFREAIKLMPVGSKWQIFIPSELAYGERGAGSTIEPNATLIFELELLSIKDNP
jgi:FKBP-type peptidyl-prolyl cis-trans isomerase